MKPGYRMIDHTADFGLEIFGPDPSSLFGQAARALFDLIVDASRLKGRHRRTIDVAGDDWADLMVNWLRELLYCWNGHGQLMADVTIGDIGPRRLTAEVMFDDFQARRHEIRNEIKGVTYHQIEVTQKADGWVARVILDI